MKVDLGLPNAEERLARAQKDLFFVQFFKDHPDFDATKMKLHFDWFHSHLLKTELVCTSQDAHADTGFYQVHFVDAEDSRLAMYSSRFEDETGRSLFPTSYQLMQWSYQGWLDAQTKMSIDTPSNPL